MSGIKVSICCLAYNHEPYIRQCLDGFVMQKCNFTYEVLIHDDASKDNTVSIIREYEVKYPDIIKPIYQTVNQHSKGVKPTFAFNFPRAQGKYIAICEGDDYWTDPYKLQKQVDFLDANPKFSICWTKFHTLSEVNSTTVLEAPDWIDSVPSDINFNIDLNNIFTPYCTYTLTCLFRRDSFNLDFFKNKKFTKDNTLYALCLTQGQGVLLNFYGAVYRMHQGGIYSSASIFKQKYFSYLNIKEIITFLPECNNKNFTTIRNFLLVDSIIYLSRKKIFKYCDLFFDSLQYFGFKKTINLFLKKIKGDTITRKSIS
jgi:glycosyltransferase involved in cell wall biosynthesis